jgi:hypothetical protein
MGFRYIIFWPIPTMYKCLLVMESEMGHLFSSIESYKAHNITLMLNKCLINIFFLKHRFWN